MQVCIITSSPDVSTNELCKTLESLKKHKIKYCSFVENENAFKLYPGEIIESLTDNGETIVCFGKLHVTTKRSKHDQNGMVIMASSNTPKSDFVQQIFSEDEKTLEILVETYPKLLESYYKLAQYLLNQKRFKEAFATFRRARLYRDNIDKSLGYVEEWHDYVLDFESGLCAYYAGEMDLGRRYTDRVLLNRNVPLPILQRAYQNYEFYVQPLKTLWNQDYVVSDMEVIPESISAYKSLNPSLVRKDNTSFYLNIRIVNWHVNPVGYNQYFSPHPKGKFKTKNLLAVVDHKGQYLQKPQLITKDDLDLKKLRAHHIDGFEDCRLFHYEKPGTLRFITNYTKNNPKGQMRLSIGTIDVNGDNPVYTSLTPIMGYNDHLTQKNWLIYKVEGDNAFGVYGHDPFTIIQIDLQTGQATPISEVRMPIRSGEFRGSAGPVPFEDGYLVVIHQVYFKNHRGRRYLHRFVQLDKDYLPIGLSNAWYLESKDIEYVSTMIALKREILIGYGLCDKCARISSISKTTISRMIRPIEDFM